MFEPEPVIPLEQRKTILTLEAKDCRWPIGEVLSPEFHFCGKERQSGLPYCEAHALRAYQPVPARIVRRKEQAA